MSLSVAVLAGLQLDAAGFLSPGENAAVNHSIPTWLNRSKRRLSIELILAVAQCSPGNARKAWDYVTEMTSADKAKALATVPPVVDQLEDQLINQLDNWLTNVTIDKAAALARWQLAERLDWQDHLDRQS